MKQMKKMIVGFAVLFFVSTFSAPPLFATIGPIILNEANDTSGLPDGPTYGTVTLTLLPDYCPGPYDGVRITVDANQAVLIPIGPPTPYGIQAFGFNYNGNVQTLNFDIHDPSGEWEVDITGGQMSEFGFFTIEDKSTGKYRLDPLVTDICDCCSDLMEGDFVVENDDGYTFAAHIAGFVNNPPGSAFFGTVKTTLVELALLEAVPGRRTVNILWITASEIDNAGFNVYRSESEDGEYIQINDSLILAEGCPVQGSSYHFIDEDVQNRRTYYYQLEDVDIYGKSTMHGPVSATPRLIYGIGR